MCVADVVVKQPLFATKVLPLVLAERYVKTFFCTVTSFSVNSRVDLMSVLLSDPGRASSDVLLQT